jgi:hypothetical protein
MDYLGLNTLDELPKLNEILQQDIVVPTEASEALPENNIEVVEPEVEIENSNIISLAVSETGELISLDNQEGTENEDEKN